MHFWEVKELTPKCGPETWCKHLNPSSYCLGDTAGCCATKY